MNALSASQPGALADVNDEGEDWDDEGEDEDDGQATVEDAGVPGLEAVFDGIRANASTTRGVDGRQQFALGRTYLAAGLVDQAVAAFGRAAHDAGVRGSACLALGELFEEQQDYAHAIEWLERGADAPQISDSDRLDAMRRLASVLEAASESARALAVWLEILTLHPEDREAPARVAKLSATGMGR
jgi:tetratricopeptide (TPR) repeat protein